MHGVRVGTEKVSAMNTTSSQPGTKSAGGFAELPSQFVLFETSRSLPAPSTLLGHERNGPESIVIDWAMEKSPVLLYFHDCSSQRGHDGDCCRNCCSDAFHLEQEAAMPRGSRRLSAGSTGAHS